MSKTKATTPQQQNERRLTPAGSQYKRQLEAQDATDWQYSHYYQQHQVRRIQKEQEKKKKLEAELHPPWYSVFYEDATLADLVAYQEVGELGKRQGMTRREPVLEVAIRNLSSIDCRHYQEIIAKHIQALLPVTLNGPEIFSVLVYLPSATTANSRDKYLGDPFYHQMDGLSAKAKDQMRELTEILLRSRHEVYFPAATTNQQGKKKIQRKTSLGDLLEVKLAMWELLSAGGVVLAKCVGEGVMKTLGQHLCTVIEELSDCPCPLQPPKPITQGTTTKKVKLIPTNGSGSHAVWDHRVQRLRNYVELFLTASKEVIYDLKTPNRSTSYSTGLGEARYIHHDMPLLRTIFLIVATRTTLIEDYYFQDGDPEEEGDHPQQQQQQQPVVRFCRWKPAIIILIELLFKDYYSRELPRTLPEWRCSSNNNYNTKEDMLAECPLYVFKLIVGDPRFKFSEMLNGLNTAATSVNRDHELKLNNPVLDLTFPRLWYGILKSRAKAIEYSSGEKGSPNKPRTYGWQRIPSPGSFDPKHGSFYLAQIFDVCFHSLAVEKTLLHRLLVRGKVKATAVGPSSASALRKEEEAFGRGRSLLCHDVFEIIMHYLYGVRGLPRNFLRDYGRPRARKHG